MLKLLAGSIAGLLFLIGVLAAALFISAGRLDFWQAWVFLAVFSGCVLLITVYLFLYDRRLLSRRVQAGPVAEKQKTQQIIQSLAGLAFLAIFVAAGLDRRFGWSHMPAWINITGDGLVGLGLLIVFLVFRENSFTSATIEVADQQRVVSSGPYGRVRHPMYSGAGLMLIGAGFALGSWVSLVFVALLMLVIAARAVDEEKFLAQNLEGYEEYREKVRYRMIPGVW